MNDKPNVTSDPIELEAYLVAIFARAIRSWSAERVRDIYALSIYRDDNEVPYRPAAYLVYNTLTQVRTCKPENPDSSEARWNLALWQDDEWLGIEERPGPHGRMADDEGIGSLDGWLESARQAYGDDTAVLIPAFATLCVRVAQRLHHTGVIQEVFGRDIPIIMHDDEWDDTMYRNTEAANPPGVASEFLAATLS